MGVWGGTLVTLVMRGIAPAAPAGREKLSLLLSGILILFPLFWVRHSGIRDHSFGTPCWKVACSARPEQVRGVYQSPLAGFLADVTHVEVKAVLLNGIAMECSYKLATLVVSN